MTARLAALVALLGFVAPVWAWEYRDGIEEILSAVPRAVAIDRSADVLIATQYLNTNDPDSQSLRVLKLSGTSGAVLWKAGPAGVGVEGWGGRPSGIAVDHRGDVLVTGREGSPIVSNGLVLKLDGETGRSRWRYIVPGADPDYRGWAELAGIDRRGDVYAAHWGETNAIVKLSGRTGAVLWKTDGLDPLDTVRFGGSIVARGSFMGRVDAIDADSGAVLWSTFVPGRVVEIAADRRGDVVVSSWPGDVGCELTRLTREAGTRAWARSITCTSVALAGNGDVAAVQSHAGVPAVMRIDGRAGEPQWTAQLETWATVAKITVAPDGDLVALGNVTSGALVLARLARASGIVMWQTLLGDQLLPWGISTDRRGEVVASSVHPTFGALMRVQKRDGRTGRDFVTPSQGSFRSAPPALRGRSE